MDSAPKNPGPLVFCDLELGGHHPTYILYLIQHRPLDAPETVFLVRRKFLEAHPDVTAAANGVAGVRFQTISLEEEAFIEQPAHPLLQQYRKWRLIQKHVRSLGCSRLTYLYFDHFQFFLALLPFSVPSEIVYFRPSFHYGALGVRYSLKEKIRAVRQLLVMKLVMMRKYTRRVYSLDPMAIEKLKALSGSNQNALWLPDPVAHLPGSREDVQRLRERLGVDEDPNRKIFLLFGEISRRKGIDELLQAMSLLPENTARKIYLVIAGPLQERESVLQRVEHLQKILPLHIKLDDRYIPETENRTYFDIADFILAPYQRHVGMSAILTRAAMSARPVLSSNYGLMGYLVKEHKLGLAVDSTDPKAIASGIERSLNGRSIFNQNDASVFANLHSPAEFARILYLRS